MPAERVLNGVWRQMYGAEGIIFSIFIFFGVDNTA
jgi:hypothetical protein